MHGFCSLVPLVVTVIIFLFPQKEKRINKEFVCIISESKLSVAEEFVIISPGQLLESKMEVIEIGHFEKWNDFL